MAIIAIDRGNGIERMDTALLSDTSHEIDNDNEHTSITEYRLNDVIVHRSVHVRLKKGLNIFSESGKAG
jgi:hypothetical protein